MDNKYTNFYGGILSKFNLVLFEINISMISPFVASSLAVQTTALQFDDNIRE